MVACVHACLTQEQMRRSTINAAETSAPEWHQYTCSECGGTTTDFVQAGRWARAGCDLLAVRSVLHDSILEAQEAYKLRMHAAVPLYACVYMNSHTGGKSASQRPGGQKMHQKTRSGW